VCHPLADGALHVAPLRDVLVAHPAAAHRAVPRCVRRRTVAPPPLPRLGAARRHQQRQRGQPHHQSLHGVSSAGCNEMNWVIWVCWDTCKQIKDPERNGKRKKHAILGEQGDSGGLGRRLPRILTENGVEKLEELAGKGTAIEAKGLAPSSSGVELGNG